MAGSKGNNEFCFPETKKAGILSIPTSNEYICAFRNSPYSETTLSSIQVRRIVIVSIFKNMLTLLTVKQHMQSRIQVMHDNNTYSPS